MRENRDIKSVKDLIQENEALTARIEFLQQENKRLLKEHRDLTEEVKWLKRQNTAMKFRCSDYSQKIMELEDKLQNVTLWDLSPAAQEEAGHALARSFLGGK